MTHKVSEVLEISLHLHGTGGGEVEEGSLEESSEDLGLVGGGGGTGDLALEAGVGDELDGELEHEAVWVLLRQLVEELSPGHVLNHLFQPGWCLQGRGRHVWNARTKVVLKIIGLSPSVCA